MFMGNGVIFVAGVYGVGKSYLCKKVADSTNIKYYSAGDLISEINGEQYGDNKKVSDVDDNQNILIRCIEEKIKTQNIILAGHMCIFDRAGNISRIDLKQIEKMHIKCLILLRADISLVKNNLEKRDNIEYPFDIILNLMETEKEQFYKLSSMLNLKPNIINMTYSECDVEEMKKYIECEVI